MLLHTACRILFQCLTCRVAINWGRVQVVAELEAFIIRVFFSSYLEWELLGHVEPSINMPVNAGDTAVGQTLTLKIKWNNDACTCSPNKVETDGSPVLRSSKEFHKLLTGQFSIVIPSSSSSPQHSLSTRTQLKFTCQCFVGTCLMALLVHVISR